MYWLNNNLDKHMLLKKSSGMQTAWRQLITSHNFNEFGNVVVVYNLDFLHSKYLVCAIFLAFFYCFEWCPISCKCYTGILHALFQKHSFQCFKTTLLLPIDVTYIYICFSVIHFQLLFTIIARTSLFLMPFSHFQKCSTEKYLSKWEIESYVA